ncbi:Hca operon transcriptional activator HcaR [Caprobacter fermentans]|uniref:Hca operon transcriptional activator HcaR n=1 Tax=Caproicibacter fermentans TaxID=2576756 RepID=A0A6N8I3J5_9FIRM|nr:LysR family transcriptional regulator [Caproicibacter fermentans]MVB12721.1 Hca operon transcriptional activator HcaR [Caproicibacter fermentans]OCN02207.1 LysR family transcriptional regulator [Clostridium sp. W14A]QNK39268.1 LysR family transcriptional regulator [Caproicibacter fermentans]
MDIKQLECFVNLSETLNFSATAQAMFISQPTVSNQIKQLEEEIGFELFKRTKREVELTKAGASFYEDIRDVIAQIHQSIVKAKNYAEKYDSTYVVAYESNFLAISFLSQIVARFNAKHPNILLDLKMTDFTRKNMLFLEKRVDFLFTVRDNVIDLPNTQYHELYRGKYVCVVSEDCALSQKKKIAYRDLETYNLILLNPIQSPEEMIQMEKRIMEECRSSPVLYTDNQLSGCTMAKCGLGVAIMPDFICIPDPTLCVIPLETEDFVPYGIVWHKDDKRKETDDLIQAAIDVYRSSRTE